MGEIHSPYDGKIEELRRNNYVLELLHINADGETSVAPICFKEHESNWHLLAVTENDRVVIFPVAYITDVSETESQTTFSLSENFDNKRFAQRFFNAKKKIL